MTESLHVESLASKKIDELASILPRRGRVYIFPHDYPDPDALASAAALHLLLKKKFGVVGQIVFTGEVSRAENKELLRHCRYHWKFLSELKTPGRMPSFFVDTTPWTGNVTYPSAVRPIGVFDHHPSRRIRSTDGLFSDIRVGSGSCASMMFEYLRVAEIPIPRWLAAMLAYAIETETLDLSINCTSLDMEAYTQLLTQANMAILGEIRNAPLPRNYYALLREAMSNAFVYGRVAWSHLDQVAQPEIVAEVADLLARMERISWSFCTAYHRDVMLVSLRSSQRGARCGSVLRRVVRKDGAGGGHHRMAAGFIQMKGMSPEEKDQRREEFVRSLLARIEKRSAQTGEPLSTMARPLVDAGGDGFAGT